MTDLFAVSNLFANWTVQAIGSVLVLCILLVTGFYVVASYRDYAAQDQETDADVLANLREMHRKGDISDREFRKIESITEQQRGTPSSQRTDAPESDAS